MTSIWAFLPQTLTVSLAAALLLLLQWLFQGILSQRWQYGVWGLLALRILLPVALVNRYVLLPFPLWVETLKAMAETHLTSAFAAPYAPLSLSHVFPYLTGGPASLTDWLFVLYLVGAVVTALVSVYGGLRRGKLRQVPLWEAVQTLLWYACRALHWCNPFLLYIFRRIQRDRDAVRALSLPAPPKEGDLPAVLPPVPGKENGMPLLLLCTTVLLACGLLWGSPNRGFFSTGTLATDPMTWDLQSTLAQTRVTRCSTVAGALDTYAKGLLTDNEVYLAIASPLSQQETFAQKLLLPPGEPMLADRMYNPVDPFSVLCITPQDDGSYTAALTFPRYGSNEEGFRIVYALYLPVRVSRDTGWVVTPLSEPQPLPCDELSNDLWWEPLPNLDYPNKRHFRAQGETGSIEATLTEQHMLKRDTDTSFSGDWFSSWGDPLDLTPQPHAVFQGSYRILDLTYTPHDRQQLYSWAGLRLLAPDISDQERSSTEMSTYEVESSGSSSNGYSWKVTTLPPGGSLHMTASSLPDNDSSTSFVRNYTIQVWLGRELAETLTLEEVPYGSLPPDPVSRPEPD